MQAEPPKILILRLRSIGDVLFTLPAVNCVRQNFPSARISFIAHQNCASLLKGFNAVDEILVLDRDVYRRRDLTAMVSATWSLLAKLRRTKFTHAIDLHGFGETALLTRWTGAASRWGIVYRKTRSYAYTYRMQRREGLHPIDVNLALLKECGLRLDEVQNDFQVPKENIEEARNLLPKLGVSLEDKHVILQPFTSNPVKNWPLPKYLALARRLREGGFKVLFGGGPADRASLEAVVQDEFPISAGTSLLTSAALASLSRLVVGGDTGLLQIAVAMQKPVLMLVNSPNTMTVPYGHPERALAPEPGRSIESISVEAAVEKCRSLLFGNATKPDKLNLQ